MPIDTKSGLTQHITNAFLFKSIDLELYILQAIFINDYPQTLFQEDILSELVSSLNNHCTDDATTRYVHNQDDDINISLDTNLWLVTQNTAEAITIISKDTQLALAPINFKLTWQLVEADYDTSLLPNILKDSVQNNSSAKVNKQNIDSNLFYFIETKTGRYYVGYVEVLEKLLFIDISYKPSTISSISGLLSSITFGNIATLPETGKDVKSVINYEHLQSQLATLRIFSHTCIDVKLDDTTYLVCNNQIGGGYLVNDKGFVVTDASIVAPALIDTLINGIFYGFDPDMLYDYYATEAIEALSHEDFSSDDISALNTQDYEQHIKTLIIQKIKTQLDDQNIQISNMKSEVYAQHLELFNLDVDGSDLSNTANQYKMQTITANESRSTYMTNGSDDKSSASLALMKIIETSDTSYPSINISKSPSTDVKSGYIIDFDNNSATPLLSEAMEINLTTKDNFYFIPNDTSNFNRIGNPVISTDNNLIGHIAYGIEPLASTDDILSFLNDNNISGLTNENEINTKIDSAIKNINNNYYKMAIKDLNYIYKSSAITTPIISSVIDDLTDEITAGKDNSPILQILRYDLYKNDIYIILILTTSTSLSIYVLVKSFKTLKNKVINTAKHKRYKERNHSIILQTHVIGNPL